MDRYSEIDMSETAQTDLTKLSVGRYCLTETKAPEGYVILTKRIYFSILKDGTAVFTDEAGTAVSSFSGTVSLETSDGNVLTVINNPGAALPNTGGCGTNLYYILGSMLIMSAGLLLLARRRLA